MIQPLILDEGRILMGTGYGHGTRLVQLQRNGTAWAADELWTTNKLKPYFNNIVDHRDYCYGFDGALLACVDLQTGERKWKRGRYGNGQVILLPDGDQLLITAETGELILLNASPDEFEELARVEIFEGKTWNHPVLVGNRLYLRNAEEAACYELSIVERAETESAGE